MINTERLIDLLMAREMSQAELARRVGITSTAINNIIKRGSGSSYLTKIARELHTSPQFLLGEIDDPSPDAPLQVQADDLVPIREIDLTFGMGATYLDVPVTEEMHRFPRAWIRRYTRAAPDRLFFAQGLGDSMEPTLYDSDLLLIDSSQKTLNMSEKIWAIAYADCVMIKRLRPVPAKDGKDAGVEVWSDKKEISPFTAYDDELRIIGRVVAVQRKL